MAIGCKNLKHYCDWLRQQSWKCFALSLWKKYALKRLDSNLWYSNLRLSWVKNSKLDQSQPRSILFSSGDSWVNLLAMISTPLLQVNSGVLAGLLTVEPEKIQAVDMDTLDARIRYTIESGEPASWESYFAIDPNSGAVRQIVPVDTSVAKKFQLVIKVTCLV